MSAHEIIAAVLLAIGLAAFAFTSFGLLAAKDFYDQIHFLAPGSIAGVFFIGAAVLAHEGFTQAGAKAILIVILSLVSNPIL